MDYLLARWYIIKSLPRARLEELHAFERAVETCRRERGAKLRSAKILPPVWWQEGALFLRLEFKKFWLSARENPALLSGMKEELAALLSGLGISRASGALFKNIGFMHQCDLAVNAAAKNISDDISPYLLPYTSRP